MLPLDRLPLDGSPAGIRITVARFYSPLKNPYTGRGVVPDLVVEQEGDASFAAARQEAQSPGVPDDGSVTSPGATPLVR